MASEMFPKIVTQNVDAEIQTDVIEEISSSESEEKPETCEIEQQTDAIEL